MSIPLLPPLTRSGANSSYWTRTEALTEGSTFILGRPSPRHEQRWHRVRSGIRLQRAVGNEATIWKSWCGPSYYAEHCVELDELPKGQPLCGTCDGRAKGHAAENGLVFSPDHLTPPRWCPSKTLYVEAGYNVGRCLACRQLAPLRATGGPYNSSEIITRHPPLDLVGGCPFHAWRSLVAVDGTAACACRVATAPQPTKEAL